MLNFFSTVTKPVKVLFFFVELTSRATKKKKQAATAPVGYAMAPSAMQYVQQ